LSLFFEKTPVLPFSRRGTIPICVYLKILTTENTESTEEEKGRIQPLFSVFENLWFVVVFYSKLWRVWLCLRVKKVNTGAPRVHLGKLIRGLRGTAGSGGGALTGFGGPRADLEADFGFRGAVLPEGFFTGCFFAGFGAAESPAGLTAPAGAAFLADFTGTGVLGSPEAAAFPAPALFAGFAGEALTDAAPAFFDGFEVPETAELWAAAPAGAAFFAPTLFSMFFPC
jgi:hypothetical protein